MLRLLNVNSLKLTNRGYRLGKRERQILLIISDGMRDDVLAYPIEGCNTRWLVQKLFPDGGIGYGHEMRDIPKVTLSRALHSLFDKGLIKMGVAPSRGREVWYKVDDSAGCYGFMSGSERRVSVTILEVNSEGLILSKRVELESDKGYSELPYKTRRWWMLTDRGRQFIRDMPNKGAPKPARPAKARAVPGG